MQCEVSAVESSGPFLTCGGGSEGCHCGGWNYATSKVLLVLYILGTPTAYSQSLIYLSLFSYVLDS